MEGKERHVKAYHGKMSRLSLQNLMNDMNLEEKDKNLIEKVIEPICNTRLDVINRNKTHKGEDIDR